MKKKAIPAQVQPIVSQISWYEIVPLNFKDLTSYDITRSFFTEKDANNYLCRGYFLEPHKSRVVKVFIGKRRTKRRRGGDHENRRTNLRKD